MMTTRKLNISRRVLLGSGLSAALLSASGIASANVQSGNKVVIIILRGAMDGLGAVPVVGREAGGDALRRFRPDLIDAASTPLGEGFVLHPSLTNVARLIRKGQGRVMHATAGPYRERSHFLAQDLLESGTDKFMSRDGWLNRALQHGPSALQAVAVGSSTPHIVKGPASVASWSPPVLPEASDDTVARLLEMYGSDPQLETALAQSIELSGTAMSENMGRTENKTARGDFKAITEAAARLIKPAGGPDIAVLSLSGWDTHASQANLLGRQLGKLDEALLALETTLGPQLWDKTLVTVVTEFGRTVRQNGTKGTDHGTGAVAFALGGAVRGRGLMGHWPGLSEAKLFENRDLYPANDVRSLFMAGLEQQFGFTRQQLSTHVFPDTAGLPTLRI
jgi:uncharacterized protein (DUF1501 family)